MPPRTLLVFVFTALAVCLISATGTTDAEPRRGWHYDVHWEPEGRMIRVAVTTRDYPAKRWVFSHAKAIQALRGGSGAGGERVFARDGQGGLVPHAGSGTGPLHYSISIDALIQRGRGNEDSAAVGRDLVTRPGLVLARPAIWPADARVTATFHLPAGTRVAVAWPRVEGAPETYALEPGALGPHTRMAFGRWTPESVSAAGAAIDVAVLDAPQRVSATGRRRWLSRAAETVADLYGGFPATHLQVIAQPMTPDRGRPVVFGRASRGGGALLHVMTSGTMPDDRFPGEWLTIHEMIHLGMPWTTLGARWLGEGVVSYYQEVLRARSGILTERDAWQTLHMWFERGRRSGGRGPLAQESRTMTARYAYHRVYWGGAALTLLMDVAIRKRWPGQRSFDDVVRYWRARYGGEPRARTGVALLESADVWLGEPLLVPLVAPHLRSAAFPDLGRAYGDLGIVVSRGRVSLRDDAALGAIRRAIMSRTTRRR